MKFEERFNCSASIYLEYLHSKKIDMLIKCKLKPNTNQ